MADLRKETRIKGVMLPANKRAEIGLTYIFGIGRPTARKILDFIRVDYDKKIKELTTEEIGKIIEVIDEKIIVEGDLKQQIQLNIKRLIDIKCYRGLRHRMGLPSRGQNTQTNARTRKGAKRTVGKKR